jgi:hypothetical protein
MKIISLITIAFVLSLVFSKSSKKINPCNLQMDIGKCRALISRYYYDAESKTCKEFNWGGCGGNLNRFETLQNCQAACQK